MCDTSGMGVRPMPSGTVTFLFTDVEGSTRLWDRQTVEMGRALRRHDEILRACIKSYNGFIFTTAGDSFCAAFGTARDALSAANAAQHEFAAEIWPDETPIRVRMGLHTGTAEIRGDDYFGPDVIRAARVEAAGHGGQILVSSVTAGLLGDERLYSVGRHRLSGFDDAIELFQFGAGEFPPVRTSSQRRNNLPPVDPPLVGRDGFLDDLLRLVDQHRFVTVVGPGGMGKTSVAKSVGYRLASRPEVEVWWCDLVSVEADDVANAAGRAIGLTSGVRDAAAVATVLAGRGATWLVLDNCEHVIGAVSQLVEELLGASDVRILATSRAPVETGREVAAALQPLDPVGAGAALFMRELGRIAGVATDDVDVDVVRAICSRLDGIPLAIELVAARARAFSLVDIELRLDNLLTSTAGRRNDRHATMAAAIEWSVQLLDEDLLPGLGALAVFPGDFDLEAAEAILGSSIDHDPVEAIETFVSHSLIETQRTDRGRVRYRMLEPIRQHVARGLWRDPDATKHCHLDYFLDKLERTYDTLGTNSCLPYLEVLTHDMADLSAVHDWALESGRIDDDLRLYRPFVMAWVHGCSDPYHWAAETAALPGIKDHDNWGAAWTNAVSGMIGSVEPDVLVEFLGRHRSISADDPSADIADLCLAITEGIFTQTDWDDSLARFARASSTDTSALFQRYFFGATVTAMAAEWTGHRPIDEAVDESIEIFDQGLGWAARIGARNIEAALLQGMASILTRSGRLATGARVAREAELMSLALGMTSNANLASYHQVAAAIQGVDIHGDPRTRLIRILESSVERDPHAPTVAYTCQVTARVLAAAGDYENAALCMFQPDVGFPDYHPRLDLDKIPDDTWTWAESESSKLTIFDVGRRALGALQRAPESIR